MTGTYSDRLSEEEEMNMSNGGSSRTNNHLSLSPVHTSDEETSITRPASNSRVSQWLSEKLNKPVISVTCGNKKGKLYKEKFNNSEPCILSEKQWFTPSEFEKFGGKERSKKWKISIFSYQKSLEALIQDGILSSPSFKKRRRQDKQNQRAQRPSAGKTRHVTNGSSLHYETSSEDEDDDDDNAKDVEDASVIQFQGDSFPVTCGEGRGNLKISRFATGNRGMCIRTEDSWLTPEKFLCQNMRQGSWRRDIKTNETPLGFLIMKRVLDLHMVNCPCPSCRKENLLDEKNDDMCFICKSDGDLVCCDGCPKSFHNSCHDPPLQDNIQGDQWICSFCLAARNQNT
ncbi:autoimmune regulator-like [Hoplias malabaricus]|uniref:autoimmune regulator-like n=1 Tax=Hoplias malabaricus TaxID=27720 RepID=UPI0034624925